MMLVLEIYQLFDDEVDLEGDNLSDKSKREFLKTFTDEVEKANKEKLYAYSVMKINNTDGTIKYGNFDIKMFHPPINLRKRLQKDQLPYSFMKITIQMPDEKKEDDLDEEQAEQRKQARDQRQAAEASKVKEVPYVECLTKQMDLEKVYERGQGIDLYIDQARYMPDCVTIVRLLARGLTKNQKKVIAASKLYPDLPASTRLIQHFDFRYEIRPETLIQP